jgi:PhzF family phenazine biosynthesis protein
MARSRPFRQVDVFATSRYRGNPVAVVLDGALISDRAMQRFANWMNLSETTFVLPPSEPDADYQVRIFTPSVELPFAGHPTLGTCHAWIEAGGRPKDSETIVQQCGAGLVSIRRTDHGLAFAAPPLVKSGPVDPGELEAVARDLNLDLGQIVDAEWTDNGPGWVSVLLDRAAELLEVQPRSTHRYIGLVAPQPAGEDTAFEVRAFFPKDGAMAEDPITGSLNAGLAMWLTRTGRAAPPYIAAQGTALGRQGRIYVTQDADGSFWVGGGTVTCIVGNVTL